MTGSPATLRGVAIALILSGCAPVIQLGDACERPSDCPTGLLCLYGRCRDECTSFRDCADGETCLHDTETGAGACRTAPESTCAVSSDCGLLSCVEQVCVQECMTTEDCGGTVCVGDEGQRTCVEPTSTECTDGSECAFGVCRDGFCDPVRSLSAGSASTCVLLESGRIACTGGNESMLLAAGTTPFFPAFRPVVDTMGFQPPFEALDLGNIHACAIANGEARCWGGGAVGQNGALAVVPPIPGAFATVQDVLDVSTAWNVNCLRLATAVWCFGSDQFGELGDAMVHPGDFPSRATPRPVELPAGLGRIVDVDTGGYHSCAIVEDGSLYCWGGNDYQQIDGGPWDLCTYAPTGETYPCHQSPVRVPGFGPGGIVAVEVALGQSHTCVRDGGGGIYCFGDNTHGQIGNGALGGSVGTPTVSIASGAVELACGNYSTCARLDDGRIAYWGQNTRGQLGTGGGPGGATPSFVEGIDDAAELVLGLYHGCALTEAGEVWCWGDADFGRLGDDPAGAAMRPPVGIPVRVRMGAEGF